MKFLNYLVLCFLCSFGYTYHGLFICMVLKSVI